MELVGTKFYKHDLSFFGSKTLGTFIKSWLIGSKRFSQKFNLKEWIILFIITVVIIYQFIVHYLFP